LEELLSNTNLWGEIFKARHQTAFSLLIQRYAALLRVQGKKKDIKLLRSFFYFTDTFCPS
jgi:hypothetical protein